VRITASAPAKAILLGEHAVNRGATALAVSVGLRAQCAVQVGSETGLGADEIVLVDGERREHTTRRALRVLGDQVDLLLEQRAYEAVRELAVRDYFAPTKYILASAATELPRMAIQFSSAIPRASGLGSGGAVFVALSAAMEQLLQGPATPRGTARRALRGDLIAHGGIASGLDTQTSLYGGAIRYSVEREGELIPAAPGLTLVIGHSGVSAATSVVNSRVRAWLAEQPVRMHYFQEIGLLSRHAEVALAAGDWAELGRLLNLNQLILERIGVSCPELEALIDAALAAGAFGAKLSGSGGGGIMIALVRSEDGQAVAEAIRAAGGTSFLLPVGVPGVDVIVDEAG
jgi:mevalonate kinase